MGNKLAAAVGYSELLADDLRLPQELELHAHKIIASAMAAAETIDIEAEDEDESEVDPNIDGVVLSSGLWSPREVTPITLENKTIMTAHGKARTNRHNDARAYASHVHNSSPSTAGATRPACAGTGCTRCRSSRRH